MPKPDDTHTQAHELLMQAFEAALPIPAEPAGVEVAVPPLAQSAVSRALMMDGAPEDAGSADVSRKQAGARAGQPVRRVRVSNTARDGAYSEELLSNYLKVASKSDSNAQNTGPTATTQKRATVFTKSDVAAKRLQRRKAQLERAHEHHKKVQLGLLKPCTKSPDRASGSSVPPPPPPPPPPFCPPKSVSFCGWGLENGVRVLFWTSEYRC
jgi:hypothetical protein